MKYSMYNVVWYDGANAYVTKYVLKSDEKEAIKELTRSWEQCGYDGEILKLDKLYYMSLENILGLRNGNGNDISTFNRFEEMYF